MCLLTTATASSLDGPFKRGQCRTEDHHRNFFRVRELDGVDDMNELTMAEKLASIDLLGDDKTMDTPRKEPSHPAVPPSADSVHVLLKQALHADDHALLLDCLYTSDEKVIAKSTSHLNPSDVLKLLKSLTSMLQLRGAVLICALPWVRSLISQHASSIVSQESSLIMLNSLYQLIESRISTFGSALQLSTSLDYLFATVPEEEAEEEEAEEEECTRTKTVMKSLKMQWKPMKIANWDPSSTLLNNLMMVKS